MSAQDSWFAAAYHFCQQDRTDRFLDGAPLHLISLFVKPLHDSLACRPELLLGQSLVVRRAPVQACRTPATDLVSGVYGDPRRACNVDRIA